jgi:hypothetical protein
MVIENDVDGEILMEMTDENLTGLGIQSFGHRYFTVSYLFCVFCCKLTCQQFLVIFVNIEGRYLSHLIPIFSLWVRHYILKRIQALQSGVPMLGVGSYSSGGSSTCR